MGAATMEHHCYPLSPARELNGQSMIKMKNDGNTSIRFKEGSSIRDVLFLPFREKNTPPLAHCELFCYSHILRAVFYAEGTLKVPIKSHFLPKVYKQ